jgi:putative colanic acid biosynthesis acetyltransferase WcaF
MAAVNEDTFSQPSFPLRDRLRRAVWNVVQATLFRWSPRPLHAWRCFLLRAFGARVGQRVQVFPRATIWAPWNVDFADLATVADDVTIYSQALISVGRRSTISQGTYVCTGTHDYEKSGYPLITKPILVGDHVWVAAEAFIHPGVVIAEGAIIGARSVVTKDIPAWFVCTGHPCQPIKPRDWRPEEFAES